MKSNRYTTSVRAPIIKSRGNDIITQKSRHITAELKLTGIQNIDPAKLPTGPSATLIHLSVRDDPILTCWQTCLA